MNISTASIPKFLTTVKPLWIRVCPRRLHVPAIKFCLVAWLGVLAGTAVSSVALGVPGESAVRIAAGTGKLNAPPVTSSSLAVTKAGSGTGTVTSNVGAINCGATCSDTYADGAPITLTATPGGGSQLTGWLGPCTGTGACRFPNHGATAVSATFASTVIGAPTLDVDGNASCDALADGLLIIRYLFGLSGPPLINGAVGSGATRT